MSRTSFDSKSLNIGELLGANSRERIVVPTFQRGYEWGKKHLEVFWEDILQFRRKSELEDGPDKYFLGPIVVLHRSRDIIELLDGQQRLATATIILSVLRDVAKTIKMLAADEFARDTQASLIAKEAGGYALQLGETDEIYFRDTIQSDSPITSIPRIRTHRNIKTARDLLAEKIEHEISGSNPQAKLTVLQSLRATIRSDLVMACVPVTSERDAFQIFETLNDRGLRLSVPDLLLNYLMKEAKPESDRKPIREVWTEMIKRMARRDINRFLRHMWVSKYGDLKSTDLFTALKSHIEGKSIGSLTFARSCHEECEYYVQLISLDEIGLGKSTKYVRTLLRNLNAQASLPLLLSAFQTLPGSDFVEVCRLVVVFVVRYSVISNLNASGLETVFYDLARRVRTMMTPAENTDDETVLPPNPSKCVKEIKSTLLKNAPTTEQIRSAVTSLILDDSGEAVYLMSRLANRMQTGTKEVTLGEANLEHIFPKNPKDYEWGGSANHEILEPLLEHIGNLTMFGERINNKASNAEYEPVKRADYAKKSELLITQQIAKDYAAWNENSIRDRASKLAEIVLDVWDFNNPSRV
jgi:hypothetical protein